MPPYKVSRSHQDVAINGRLPEIKIVIERKAMSRANTMPMKREIKKESETIEFYRSRRVRSCMC